MIVVPKKQSQNAGIGISWTLDSVKKKKKKLSDGMLPHHLAVSVPPLLGSDCRPWQERLIYERK